GQGTLLRRWLLRRVLRGKPEADKGAKQRRAVPPLARRPPRARGSAGQGEGEPAEHQERPPCQTRQEESREAGPGDRTAPGPDRGVAAGATAAPGEGLTAAGGADRRGPGAGPGPRPRRAPGRDRDPAKGPERGGAQGRREVTSLPGTRPYTDGLRSHFGRVEKRFFPCFASFPICLS